MNRIRYILLFALMCVIASCGKDSEGGDNFDPIYGGNLTIHGELEAVDTTGGSWQMAMDEIKLYFGSAGVTFKFEGANDKYAGNVKFVSGNSENSSQSVSTNYDTYWAVYPSSSAVACDGSSVQIELPYQQTAIANGFDDELFAAVAKSEDYEKFSFYNVFGGIRFKVDEAGIDRVEFKGNSEESLAGVVVVGMDDSGMPTIKSVVEPCSSITLAGEIEAGKWYYIVTAPVEFSEGYTFNFYKEDKVAAVYTTNSSFEIERSAIAGVNISGLEFYEIAEPDPSVEPTPEEPQYIIPEGAKRYSITIDMTTEDEVQSKYNISSLVKGGDANATVQMAYIDENGQMAWRDWNYTTGRFGVYGGTTHPDQVVACIKPNANGTFEYIAPYRNLESTTTATAILDYGNGVIVAIEVHVIVPIITFVPEIKSVELPESGGMHKIKINSKDGYNFVHYTYTVKDGLSLISDEADAIYTIDDDSNGNITINVKENTGATRSAYLLALPNELYDAHKNNLDDFLIADKSAAVKELSAEGSRYVASIIMQRGASTETASIKIANSYGSLTQTGVEYTNYSAGTTTGENIGWQCPFESTIFTIDEFLMLAEATDKVIATINSINPQYVIKASDNSAFVFDYDGVTFSNAVWIDSNGGKNYAGFSPITFGAATKVEDTNGDGRAERVTMEVVCRKWKAYTKVFE